MRQLSLFVLLIHYSCSIADFQDSQEVNCDAICSKKSECGEIKTEEVNICVEGCNKLKKYGYFQSNVGKSLNDCAKEVDCNNFSACINRIKCKEPDFDIYVNSRCNKFDECGSAIPKVVCLTTGKESVKSEITNSFLRCATDKLFEDISSCIRQGSCEYIESYTESCLEYYYIMKYF